jgi:MYXO-CTERM domain-containing protein
MSASEMRLILAAGVFATVSFWTETGARACSCVRPPPPLEELAGSAAVFEGKVTHISSTPVPGSYPQLVEVELDVARVWKGEVTRATVVRTATSDASCGVYFAVGTTYLIYAQAYEQALLASLCSRTTSSDTAAADFLALGPAHAPTDAPPSATTGCTASGTQPPHTAATLLIAAVTLLALRRRRR